MKNEKLTLLLVLKGRHDFSDRWLEYANLYLNDYRILIADGNDQYNKYTLDKSKYPNLEIENPEFPYDKNIECFIRKIKSSLGHIDSKYILYCENDDLMISSEIKNVLDFLEKNDEYVSARGEIFNFSISSINEVYGKIIEFKRFNNFIDLSESKVFERINSYSKNKHGLYHNITKKEVFNEMISKVIESKFFDLVIFQYFWNFFIPISGKIYCSKNIYMLHQDHSNMISRNSDIMSFDKSLFYNEDKFKKFFFVLAKTISTRYNIEIQEAKFEILNFFSYNELLNIMRDNNKNNYSIKKHLINLMRKNKFSNFALNYKKRKNFDFNSENFSNLKFIQNFLLKK